MFQRAFSFGWQFDVGSQLDRLTTAGPNRTIACFATVPGDVTQTPRARMGIGDQLIARRDGDLSVDTVHDDQIPAPHVREQVRHPHHRGDLECPSQN